MNRILVFIIAILFIWACEPQKADDIDIGPLPEQPQLSLSFDENDPNRVIVEDNSTGFFNRLWVADGASPLTSTKQRDTFFYAKAGNYTITLHAAKIGGSGTSSTSQTITIDNDATVVCGPQIALLTGDCGSSGKCWKFSTVMGAITVGPTYGSGEWYRSPANGLVPEQMASSWCFHFEDASFEFINNGVTISPWDGYSAIPHDPTPGPWQLSIGTGMNGVDQILLTPGQFMGTWDSNNVLDIVLLTEDQLVVRARIVDQQGVPAAEGWFEFYFVAD